MIIDHHHNGPRGRGHGGVSAGRFAEAVDARAATVRLRRPVPLGVELDAVPAGDHVEILDRDELVATVSPLAGRLAVGRFSSVSDDALRAAEREWLDERDGIHMAPTCFACGDQRTEPGLGLFSGPVGGGVYGCRWRPDGIGVIPDWLIWAALDCPTGVPAFNAVSLDEAVVTAELSVEIGASPFFGSDLRILSRRTDFDGRRHRCEAVLVDAAGRRLAVAVATWVTVPIATLIALAAV